MSKVANNLLITGATGFIGRALCDELAQSDYSVRGAVRGPSCPAGVRCDLMKVGDLGLATDWSAALDGVDIVVHLAARVHVMRDRAADPLSKFREVNVDGTLNLVRQAAKAGVRRVVYLSSIKVNGEQTLPSRPFTEHDVLAPLDPYAISKYEAEEGLRALARKTGIEVVIIRPPLVYGVEVKGNFLHIMRLLHKGVPLPFGSIHNRRSLVALDNLLDLIVICLEHPAAANQTFLVSDGEDLSTTELFQRLAQALDRPARLIPMTSSILVAGATLLGRHDMIQRLCGSLQVDISKARTLLGWFPPIDVSEGLRRTAEGFLHEKTF